MSQVMAIDSRDSTNLSYIRLETASDGEGSSASGEDSSNVKKNYPEYTIDDHLLTLQSIKNYDLSNEAGINALPRRRNKSQRPLAMKLALLLYPELPEIAAIIRYDEFTSPAKAVVRQRQKERSQIRIAGREQEVQGPWAGQDFDPVDLKGPAAIPMPVKIGSTEDFAPIFNFLGKNKAIHEGDDLGTHGHELLWENPTLEFDRGIVYEDGRLDLCKKVVGPTHIGKLMESLESNQQIRHFLLGNNAISTTGAKRIAEFLHRHPNRMETWYLAGCHITRHGLSLLAQEMIVSSSITNLWFKRNPFGPNSADLLAQLVLQTAKLRTLDLETTELGDEGVHRFITQITGKPAALRHLYLNANGIGEKACMAIGKYLADPHCLLESIFLSTNPIGDAGMLHLAPGVSKSKTLIRFTCASAGLTSKGLAYFADTVTAKEATAPLQTLDFGASQTTVVHGLKFNYTDDTCIESLKRLIMLPTLRWLNLGRAVLTAVGIQAVRDTAISSSLVFLDVQRLQVPDPSNNTTAPTTSIVVKSCSLDLRNAMARNQAKYFPHIQDYKQFLNSEEFRFLRNTDDVRKIDSMYRTRDKRLGLPVDQEWEEGDPTWKLILEDAKRWEGEMLG